MEDADPDASRAVAELSARWWELLMERSPTWATLTGDHRYDHRLGETGPAARARFHASVRRLLAEVEEARGGLASRLAPEDQTTLDLLALELALADEAEVLALATFDVDQMNGPQAWLPYFVTAQHPMRDIQDAENLLARYREVPAFIDGLLEDLAEGLAAGRTAPRIVVERVLEQLDALLSDPAQSAFVRAASRVPAGIAPDVRARLVADLTSAARSEVHEGFSRYRRFLAERYLPAARTSVGLFAMPGGREVYAHLARRHTTTSMSPEEIHALGERELARIRAEIEALARQRGHVGDAHSFLLALRAEPSGYAKSREELLETFREALRRADEKLPSAFGRLPKLPYKVEPMDKEREKDAPAAYYQPGSLRAGRPGIFVANLHRFEERPLMNSEVLAFHEAVPGHHLQIAISQEIEHLPRFRAEGGFTAFVEGWALYSERLADELGLYSSLESRAGYLGFQGWRAARLVVDTGIHHFGLSRAEAIEILAANTTLGRVDVENEIDRYIAMPGQALAYMVGCLRILELRETVRRRLGAAFDLRSFHDALLSGGGLPLDVLPAHVFRELGIDAGEPGH